MQHTFFHSKQAGVATLAGLSIAAVLFMSLSTVMPGLFAAYCAFGLFGVSFFIAYLFHGKQNLANRVGIMAMAVAAIFVVFMGMNNGALSALPKF